MHPTAQAFRTIHHLVVDSEANSLEFIDLICALLRYMEPPEEGFRIVESGTYCGTTALCLGWTMRQYGLTGHVYTADPKDWATDLRIEQNELEDYITYVQSDFIEMLDSVKGSVDIALIDCTDWKRRVEHINAVIPRMADGGLIVVDDIDQEPDSPGLRVSGILESASLLLHGHRGCAMFQIRNQDVDSDTVDHAKS